VSSLKIDENRAETARRLHVGQRQRRVGGRFRQIALLRRRDGHAIGVHAGQRRSETDAEILFLLLVQHLLKEIAAQRSRELHDRVADVEPIAVNRVDAILGHAGLLRQSVVVLLHPELQEALVMQRHHHAVRQRRSCQRRIIQLSTASQRIRRLLR
jgi:hypothetical protein